MTENLEAAELQAQLAECQHIISAQADALAAAHKDNAILKSHSEMMTLRAKKAEEELAALKTIELDRQGRGEPVEEPFVRYCPGCSSVGTVDGGYQGCCPNGSEARMIPRPLAEKCRDTFSIAIRAMMADRAANKLLPAPREDA